MRSLNDPFVRIQMQKTAAHAQNKLYGNLCAGGCALLQRDAARLEDKIYQRSPCRSLSHPFSSKIVSENLMGIPFLCIQNGSISLRSSGIPQLIGLLNGCDLKGEFSLRSGGLGPRERGLGRRQGQKSVGQPVSTDAMGYLYK